MKLVNEKIREGKPEERYKKMTKNKKKTVKNFKKSIQQQEE